MRQGFILISRSSTAATTMYDRMNEATSSLRKSAIHPDEGVRGLVGEGEVQADRVRAEQLVRRLRVRLDEAGVESSFQFADEPNSAMCLVYFDVHGDQQASLAMVVSATDSRVDILDPGDVPCRDEEELLRYCLARANGTSGQIAASALWVARRSGRRQRRS